MSPITFLCHEVLPLPPEDIARQILDVSQWPGFRGYGPIPGIRSATFDVQMPGVVGTRIYVTNLDGSNHVEEVVEWQPDRRVALEMKEFSPPLSRLATAFHETWEFNRVGLDTHVTRSFRLYPKSVITRFPLWMISLLLRRAIARNLREMKWNGPVASALLGRRNQGSALAEPAPPGDAQ
jgi:hypothetical protein